MLEGTPEDRAACESDVRRYCQAAIPDNMRVLACLQQVRARISPACRGVLEKYGQ
jgi:Cysteine rich repeat